MVKFKINDFGNITKEMSKINFGSLCSTNINNSIKNNKFSINNSKTIRTVSSNDIGKNITLSKYSRYQKIENIYD